MRAPSALLLSLALLAAATVATAAPRLEIIELRHRSAEELLPLLEPHLAADSSASGQGQQLIIKAEHSELAALQAIIQELDRPRRSLLLSLRRDGGGSLQEDRLRASGSTRGGRVRITRSDSALGEHGMQQLRGLEGRPMRIDQQLLLPLREQLVWHGRSGAGYHSQIRHLELSAGLYAIVHLRSGERIDVEIVVQERSSDDPLQSRRLLTTVSGRLDEWILLASLDSRRQECERGVIYRSQAASEQAGSLWLRVQALD